MVRTTIRFCKQGVIPPVYLAGTFTGWQAKELGVESAGTPDADCSFSTTLDIPSGTHQYKFRLGSGDWWVTDECVETSKQRHNYR